MPLRWLPGAKENNLRNKKSVGRGYRREKALLALILGTQRVSLEEKWKKTFASALSTGHLTVEDN